MNVDGIATQLEIDWGRIRVPEFDRGSSLQARFEAFHAANPDVYTALVRLSRTLVARGRTRIGIAMLFEVLRWNHAVSGGYRYSGPDFLWAVGLFEGEGTFFCKDQGRYVARRMTFSSVDEDVVRRFHAVVGVGTVRGPYFPKIPNRQPFYRWRCDRWNDLAPLVRAMIPHLGERRRAAAQRILDNPALPHGGDRRSVGRPTRLNVRRLRDDDFLLNNNFRSRYVRLIQRNEPDLARVFETRELKA